MARKLSSTEFRLGNLPHTTSGKPPRKLGSVILPPNHPPIACRPHHASLLSHHHRPESWQFCRQDHQCSIPGNWCALPSPARPLSPLCSPSPSAVPSRSGSGLTNPPQPASHVGHGSNAAELDGRACVCPSGSAPGRTGSPAPAMRPEAGRRLPEPAEVCVGPERRHPAAGTSRLLRLGLVDARAHVTDIRADARCALAAGRSHHVRRYREGWCGPWATRCGGGEISREEGENDPRNESDNARRNRRNSGKSSSST